MSEQMQSLVAQWRNLNTQAESGDLRLDPAVGNALKAQAEQMKTKLDDMLVAARQLGALSGFGALQTATTMQQKFENKAVAGDGSAVQRLLQSVEVLTLMAETYEKAVRTIEDTDQANSQKLANVELGGK
ncbi:hypothetical protein [Nocardia bovistercoris]|uniref:Uncharacterized protein n=1 Tax=Nocardia bovistercoris TaxID=2785916 RepID=A0A931N2L3_9NOCA|nr:hypothetical protein [Nocardia bovistercoris]MBH0776842.1 hypothetical protein [Nocardia bovistercoris]